MNIKYLLGSIISIPLLPLMYFQGKKIRANVPKLPEATDSEGEFLTNSKTRLSLLAIGESTIAGVGVKTHEEGFTGSLAKELAISLNTNVSWKVYAKSGFTIKTVCDKIIPKIQETNVQLIVVGIGGNDGFNLTSPKKWRAEADRLISLLRHKYPDALIVFCNMPPIRDFPAFTPLIKFVVGHLVDLFGEELKDLVDQKKKVLFNSNKITLEDWISRLEIDADSSDFFSDGVHPSKLTYQTWAKDLASLIVKNKKKVQPV